jgi:hypothetical protein
VVAVALGAAFVAHSASRKQPFVVVNMLARNAPLSVTYLRAFAISIVVHSIVYCYAYWLESALGRVCQDCAQARTRFAGLLLPAR